MKLKKAVGTRTTVSRNIEEARRMLGEINYLSFKPTQAYKVKNGFIALRTKPFLYPQTVLIRSRGSFLELRIDEVLFQKPIVEYLRKGLWVPLFIGPPLPLYARDKYDVHVHPEQREEFNTLYARLS